MTRMTAPATATGESPDDPVDDLKALRRIAERRAELDREEYYHVMRLRSRRVAWEAIAAALGVSRQAAHKRFRGRTGPT
jgi:hypothetical protein